jgi:isoquinoline 1-oxidoreductase beta subunit
MPEAVAPLARKFRLTRRGFLVGLANTGVGLALGVRFGSRAFAQEAVDDLAPIEVDIAFDEDPLLWFEILSDNTVRIIIPKSEMGQGVHTSMGQICADELGANWDQVQIVQGGTSLGAPDTFGTVGSFSVQSSYMPMRNAAACMRQMLLEEAARKLEVPVGELSVANGRVQSGIDPHKALSFGEIVTGVTRWTEPATEPVLKDPAEFTLIGTSVPRCDYLPKLRGEPVYGYDQRREGMLYGAVARPPALSAKMKSASAGKAASMPGVVQVVIDESTGFAGVVARTRERAWKAVKALDIRVGDRPAWNLDDIEACWTYRTRRGGGPERRRRGGHRQRSDLVADYRTPPCMHAPSNHRLRWRTCGTAVRHHRFHPGAHWRCRRWLPARLVLPGK